MTTHRLPLLAAVLLAGSAVPALAQERYDPGEPPPLPALPEHDWHDWDADPQGPYPDEPGERGVSIAPAPGVAGPDPRAAWLDQCRDRMSPGWRDGPVSCESYLLGYERAYAAPAGQAYRYGYLPGYPGPVMWVRVPVERGPCREMGE